MGANIGTTITGQLINIIGTIGFTTLCLTLPITDFIAKLTPDAPAAQIANMHTTFNIVTTLLLLPRTKLSGDFGYGPGYL